MANMTLTKLVLLCGLYTCSTVFPVHSQSTTTAKTYALVVGIAGYENKTIPALQYADKDARLFAQWLQTKTGGSIPDYQIKLLTNENAHIAAVYSGLDWLKQSATIGDTVFIYFSGHGDIETKDSISQGYLLAWNSPANNYRNNAISINDLNNIANSITTLNKASVVLITDACHSGKMAGDFYKGRQFSASNLRLVLNNQVRLASCRADELAAEGPFWGGGRGVFSYYLLKGLNGKAGKEGRVKLKDLQTYLDTSLATDKYLKLDNHLQHPVSDGSPLFTMAKLDATLQPSIETPKNDESQLAAANTAGLQSLKTTKRQPIDYFFELANGPSLDAVLPFTSYSQQPTNEVPNILLNDYTSYLKMLGHKLDSLTTLEAFYTDLLPKNKDQKDSILLLIEKVKEQSANYQERLGNVALDTLQMLQAQLKANKYIRDRFIEKFVQLTHQKSQDMINAYLQGDLAELEKRQYYYSGSRDYRSFLPVMTTAIHLVPTSNYLHDILKINHAYIAGLVDRLDITLQQEKSDSLLAAAIAKQEKALALEPYAAYIHNELGNLYLQKRQFEKAAFSFEYALTLSPTWAIPWSNKIRLNFAQGNLKKAKEAIHTADSLQPNLAYVHVNAGLVMEKDNNLLAAEGYYLSSIAQNNVHYLPYERLGKIYIQTGDYEKADSFLYESIQRKDAFAVNQAVFDFGIELGGKPEGENHGQLMVYCDETKDKSIAGWGTYQLLYKALLALAFPTSNEGDSKQLLNDVMQKIPNTVLANHYLGKKYFTEGNWQMALLELKKAKTSYLTNDELRTTLQKILTDSLLAQYNTVSSDQNKLRVTAEQYKELQQNLAGRADSSCLVTQFINLNYDVLEDNYMLAHIYSQKGLWGEAIEEYKIIAGIENLRQMEQAVLKDFEKYEDIRKNFQGTEEQYERLMIDYLSLIAKYNNPIRMGGCLKTAAIYKQMGRYELAEEMLLKQVTLNQQAGYARQEQMNIGNFGPTGTSSLNYYWLDVNRDLEVETYNFYNSMINIFPRDAYWYKKAGLFLYDRLKLTYTQLPYAERSTFYNYSKAYAYPFEGSDHGPNQWLDDSGQIGTKQNYFSLPATGEIIRIEMSNYDPLLQANNFLKSSIQFSGETASEHAVDEAIADLNAWMGNVPEAIGEYRILIQEQPNYATIRNKLIEQLLIAKNFVDAASQLDSLQQRNQATRAQQLQLANFYIMGKNEAAGFALLNSFTPGTEKEQQIKDSYMAKYYLLKKEPKKALPYLNSLTPTTYANDEALYEQAQNSRMNLYTKARIWALTGNEAKALEGLKISIDSGFNYQYVLNTDPTWDKLRLKKGWKKLMKGYEFENSYAELASTIETTNVETVLYRIPILNARFSYH
jgi:tetratricopeptide (TPR) repeat protein